MVLTKKFSEFNNGNDLENDDTTVGLRGGVNTKFDNPWVFLAPGTTAERPAPSDAIAYRLRFNEDLSAYEFYDNLNAEWVQLENTSDLNDLIARLAAHTAGDGASMIGLQDLGAVVDKTVQNLAAAVFVTSGDESTVLANSVQLSSLALLLAGGTMAGAIDMDSNAINNLPAPVLSGDATNKAYVDGLDGGNVKSVTGTSSEVGVNNSDPQNPVVLLPAAIDAPGTFTIQSTVALNAIIDDDTFATATNTNVPTSESVKSYVDSELTGYVQSVSGTLNEIDVDNTDAQNPTLSLPSTLVAPGTVASGNVLINTNTISSTNTNGDLILSPDGTGDLTLDGVNWPQADGANGQVLGTDGAGQTEWVSFPPGTGTVTAGLENELAFYPADGDTVEGLATGNSATLVTSSTGVPSYTASMQDGELLIGVTGGTPVPATLTAGPGISIAQSAGGVTISGTGSGIGWTEVTSTTKAMVSDNGYIANNSSEVVFTLPTTAAVGTVINVVGKGSGGWKIEQNAGQSINIGDTASTSGTGGNVSSTNQHDSLQLLCVTADTVWTASVAPQGNINIV